MKRQETDDIQTVALIPAAGQGIRMGGGRPKQFLQVDGTPLLALTLAPFQACPHVNAIVVAVPADEVAYCREQIVSRFHLDKVTQVIPGGERRQDSVRRGLEGAGTQWDLVVIHDGVRPLVEEAVIERVIGAGRDHRCVITGIPATDTVKEVGENGRVVKTYDRGRVWLVQTPQVFRYHDIRVAHERACEEEWQDVTDDAAMVERLGVPVTVIKGSEKNIKVTTPQDLELVRFWMRDRRP